jgi:hypothetical protein
MAPKMGVLFPKSPYYVAALGFLSTTYELRADAGCRVIAREVALDADLFERDVLWGVKPGL